MNCFVEMSTSACRHAADVILDIYKNIPYMSEIFEIQKYKSIFSSRKIDHWVAIWK
jgi:hypothetical protein